MTDKAISPLRRRLIEDMTIRRLGPGTQHQYIRHVKSFADFVGRSPDKATPEDVRRYQLRLASIGTTVPTLNAGASALRFFFRVTLKRRDLADAVVSVREPRRLPVVLSPEEVSRLLASTTNIKHKAALSLAYATGLRSSEVVSLKLTDIDSDRMVIRVEQGKGKKDRYVILSPNLLDILREWWRAARKKGWMHSGQPWLFPGYRGQHMSRRQLHRLVRMAAERAGITKRVGVHTLRHSFATHLWSRRPISASSRCCSKQRHTARQHPIEGRIYYPFHPRCGETCSLSGNTPTVVLSWSLFRSPTGRSPAYPRG
jgi:Site-specific recombinase XerD